MRKVYNSFIKAIEDKILVFNPHSYGTAILNNPDYKDESEFEIIVSEDEMKVLFDNDILISDENYAQSLSCYFSDKVKYNRTITISDAMTFSCNMECIYCFENNILEERKRIPIEKRILVITQLIELYIEDIDIIDYVFFGGEPLLDLDYIDNICSTLLKRYPDKKIDFSFTSNGTLINNEFIDLCNKYDFEEIRITMDGPSRIHNQRRIMRNGEQSYEIIAKNIKLLCNKTNIRIVINTVLDKSNESFFLEMFDEMKEQHKDYICGETPQIVFNIGILCHPLHDTSHTKRCGKINKYGNNEFYILSKKLLEKGAVITSPFYSAQCLNSSEKSFTITPTGNIYKCVTGVGEGRFLLSSYNDFLINPYKLVRNNIVHIENSHSGECRTCDYFAMCNGGCKCQYYEKGDILCRKQLFEDEMDYLMELLFVGEFDERGFFRRRIS